MNTVPPLFFNDHLTREIDWKGHLKVRLGPVHPINKEQISRSLKDLSAASIRNRFLGTKKEFSSVELDYLTNLDGWDHFALGLEERSSEKRGIGIARMVRSKQTPGEAEIALTVIDEYQGLGLGLFLIQLITLAALERQVRELTFTYLPQNDGILRLIKKIGTPRVGDSAMDFMQIKVHAATIDVEEIRGQLRPYVPTIGAYRVD